MTDEGTPAPPGWYVDAAGATRWWDGVSWTDHVAPAGGGPAVSPPATWGGSAWTEDPAATAWPAAPQDAPARSDARRGPRSGAVVLLVLGGLALVALAVVAVGLLRGGGSTPATASLPTTTTPPAAVPGAGDPTAPSASASPTGGHRGTAVTSATQGTVVFSDDFSSAGSGWPTRTLPSGTTFAYQHGRYVVVAKGALHHYAYAPYQDPVVHMSVTAHYVLDPSASGQSGVGVTCDQGSGAQALLYEFVVFPGHRWFIEQVRGSIATGSTPRVLAQGTTSAPRGRLTVTGTCVTRPDGKATALTLFVNGHKVRSVTSTRPAPADGWLGGLVVASTAGAPQRVAVDSVVLRDTAS